VFINNGIYSFYSERFFQIVERIKLFMQNLFIIDFNSGIGKELMPLFHLGRWKTASMYGKIKNTYINTGLDDISQPIGIAEYELIKVLREEFKSSLPTVEEIESELSE